LNPDVGPTNPGSQHQTQELLVLIQPKKLGPDAGLKRLGSNEGSIILGQTGLQDLRDLSLRLTIPKILGWGALSCPKFLGFEKECLTQNYLLLFSSSSSSFLFTFFILYCVFLLNLFTFYLTIVAWCCKINTRWTVKQYLESWISETMWYERNIKKNIKM